MRTEPGQYRFGVHLALCHQALGEVLEPRTLVERMTAHREAAAAKAGAELKALAESLKARQVEAGQLTADGEIDLDHLTDAEKQSYDNLRLTARFSRFDLDFLMSWVLLAEAKPEEALEHLARAGKAESRRPSLHIQIGETLGAMRKWPEAEAAFRRALALDPRNPHVRKRWPRWWTGPSTASGRARSRHRSDRWAP